MSIPLTEALIIFWLTLWQIYATSARLSFLKDQSMDVVFPYPVHKSSSSSPEGHMHPLGAQRRPDGPIHEEKEMPGIREFYEKYVQVNKPAVFRQSISTQAPAFLKWSDDKYLNEKYGNLNVSVRVKLARRQSRILSENKMMKLKRFIYDYLYENLYLASNLPKQMMPDLPLPKCLRCGTLSENLLSVQLWMSAGGTSSLVHSHDNHLMHCVIFGRRDFILIEESHKNAFPWTEDYPGSLGGHSDMDTEMVNMFSFKSILRVPWIWSTLYPGNCLFVPAGYLHQVRSYGRSISITVEFFPVTEFDDSGCELNEQEFIPLSDAYFLTVFANGRLRLQDEELNAERLRHILISLVDRNDVLKLDKFDYFFKEVVGEDPALPNPYTVFKILNFGNHLDQISKTSLLSLDSSLLQKMADVFNKAYAEIENQEQDLVKEEELATNADTERGLHEEF
ncbi:unnamed protein product [Candidula unifasciata]|uniref:JmjC domain-containing protein n=1 Tax=Candidula unifasciata TaxID=100452 RepID=A0A8S3ZN29_9EUPU|nr:unnamed protein product [Candidula unifasciata]